jgi:hypothetical protein
MKVKDLDVLRPEPKLVKLGDREIDVSFIPCGITFDIDQIIQKLNKLDREKLQAGGDETRIALDLSIQLCSTFCSRKYPEMDKLWFEENVSTLQIEAFASEIQGALIRAYAGIPKDSAPKNPRASRKKSQP